MGLGEEERTIVGKKAKTKTVMLSAGTDMANGGAKPLVVVANIALKRCHDEGSPNGVTYISVLSATNLDGPISIVGRIPELSLL